MYIFFFALMRYTRNGSDEYMNTLTMPPMAVSSAISLRYRPQPFRYHWH
jgi:hypothetical protein